MGFSSVSPKEQREFAKRVNLTYPLFIWERDKLPKLLQAIVGYPTTLLVDRNGRIREVVFGILFGEQKENFERKLRAILEEKTKTSEKRQTNPKVSK